MVSLDKNTVIFEQDMHDHPGSCERKLALDDDILMHIEKPERYIGGEYNSVMKDPAKVDVRFAFCFPDVYEIGMSHLGLQILYDMFNTMEDVWCERVFSPWIDLDALMRKHHIPLFALESQEPVRDFDFLGITIQYEMCYTNILQILDLAQIPFSAVQRGDDCPIVIGGGPCTYNLQGMQSSKNRPDRVPAPGGETARAVCAPIL